MCLVLTTNHPSLSHLYAVKSFPDHQTPFVITLKPQVRKGHDILILICANPDYPSLIPPDMSQITIVCLEPLLCCSLMYHLCDMSQVPACILLASLPETQPYQNYSTVKEVDFCQVVLFVIPQFLRWPRDLLI